MVRKYLPTDSDSPVMFKMDPSMIPIMGLAIKGNRTPEELRKLSEDVIQKKLEQIDGVASAYINGGREKCIRVDIPRERLEAYNLTISEIAQLLGAQNVQSAGGAITSGDINYTIQAAGKYKSLDDVRNTVISWKTTSAEPGSVPLVRTIKLRDIADVYEGCATIASYESGKLTWEEAVKSNELNVKKLFYALLLQQESLNLQKASLENARQRMNQAATNYRNGYIPQISYLQTQVAYENQVPTVEKAEAAMRQSLDTFTFIIGMPIGTKVRLEGEINPEYVDVDVDSLVEKSLENNLSVKSLKQSIKTLKMQSTALGLSTYTPSLALSWNGNPVITNALKNDWGEKDNWKDNGALSFSLVWNITNMLPWSSNGTTAKELSANIDKLETNLEVLRRNTELEIRTAVDSLNQSKKVCCSASKI